MARTCTVCRHADRAAIDGALMIRGSPYRGIAQQFNLPPDPVYRHMQAHLRQLLRNAAGLQDLIDGKRLLNELIDLHQLERLRPPPATPRSRGRV